ncbi:hypothetical protein L1987_46532 [Smallanthus sonchifolius]|uniref:Uncharacterized protein n=1 Tax=Smallanthus sonchifolius TaxID=185202 RepID=A0ACB9G0M4_9ASTR|nr:hypothetical protein L1987_46532 [Smallanthus sonchifolius]
MFRRLPPRDSSLPPICFQVLHPRLYSSSGFIATPPGSPVPLHSSHHSLQGREASSERFSIKNLVDLFWQTPHQRKGKKEEKPQN